MLIMTLLQTTTNDNENRTDSNENDNYSRFPFTQDFNMPQTQKTPEIKTMEEAKAMIESLMQEIEVAKSNAAEDKLKIESLEEAIKKKGEHIDIIRGTINSLELEILNNKNAINSCKDIFTDQNLKN